MSLMVPGMEVDSAAAHAGFDVSWPAFFEADGSVHVGGCRSDLENSGGSSESSLIGAANESSLSPSEEEEEEEVESRMRKHAFGSMDSLEDALPAKSGLSSFFNGKSKSFAALSDVVTQPTTATDLAKPEHTFNKRRRILMANRSRWRRRSSFVQLPDHHHPHQHEPRQSLLPGGG